MDACTSLYTVADLICDEMERVDVDSATTRALKERQRAERAAMRAERAAEPVRLTSDGEWAEWAEGIDRLEVLFA